MSGGTLVVLDTTVLSNFARSNSVDWLVAHLDDARTVPSVRFELEDGIASSHEYLERATAELGNDGIVVDSDLPSLPGEFAPILATLDRGEAESLVPAKLADGTLATDDAAARSVAREHDVRVTGSIGLLVRGIVDGDLDEERAQGWLETWIEEESYYAPVDHVSEALPEEP